LIGSIVLAISLVARQSQAEPLVVDHGQLYVRAAVNGAATEAMLDSGVATTLIDNRFAKEANLAEGSPLTAQGSAGAVSARAIDGIVIETLGLAVRPATAVVTDLGELSAKFVQRPTPVVLGRELFDSARLVIDIPGRRISVAPRRDKAAGEQLQLTEHGGMEAIPVRANGVESQADLDFGNGGVVLISRALAQRLQLKAARHIGGRTAGEPQRDVVVIGSLKMGGVEFANVTAVVNDQPTASDLNIGTAILGNFRITTDYPARSIWLQRVAADNARPSSPEDASGDQLLCEYRTPVGSHLQTRVCRTREQLEAEQSDAENRMRTLPRSGATKN
jgi:predicted aspartyl protease